MGYIGDNPLILTIDPTFQRDIQAGHHPVVVHPTSTASFCCTKIAKLHICIVGGRVGDSNLQRSDRLDRGFYPSEQHKI